MNLRPRLERQSPGGRSAHSLGHQTTLGATGKQDHPVSTGRGRPGLKPSPLCAARSKWPQFPPLQNGDNDGSSQSRWEGSARRPSAGAIPALHRHPPRPSTELWRRHLPWLPFEDERSEAQRGEVTSSRSQLGPAPQRCLSQERMPGSLPAERARAVSAQEPSRSRVSRITGVPRGLGLGQLLLRVLSQGPACHPARPHPRLKEPRPCLPDPKPQAWTQPSSGGGRATAKVTSSAQSLAELREGPISLSLSPVMRSSQAASEGDAGESGGAETRVLPAHREGTKGPGGLPSGRRPPAAQPAVGRNDAFPAGHCRLSGSPDSRALQVRWASAGPLGGGMARAVCRVAQWAEVPCGS